MLAKLTTPDPAAKNLHGLNNLVANFRRPNHFYRACFSAYAPPPPRANRQLCAIWQRRSGGIEGPVREARVDNRDQCLSAIGGISHSIPRSIPRMAPGGISPGPPGKAAFVAPKPPENRPICL